MRTRIVAALTLVAAAIGVFGAVQLGLVYHSVIVLSAEREAAAVAGEPIPEQESNADLLADVVPEVELTEQQEDELAASEAANAASWTLMQQFTDQCMEDAGFPEYTWPGADGAEVADPTMFQPPWFESLPAERQAAAELAQWGDAAAGADYRWEDAGCAGYGTHMIGADELN